MNLVRILEDSAARYPRKTALYFGFRSYSYARVNAWANQWSSVLSERFGVRPGDRVAILLKNCPEFISAAFGVLKLGCVLVPVNQFLKGPEIQYICADAAVRAVITSRDFDEVLTGLQGPAILKSDDAQVVSWLKGAHSGALEESIDPSRDAVIIYTSGTTGRPKGAVLTHRNIYSNTEGAVKTIDCSSKDRFLLVLPMFHSFTFTVCIMMPLSIGASVIIVPSIQPFNRALRNMLFRGATLFAAVPQVFQVLAEKKIPAWAKSLLRLRLCISGAAALPVATMEKFEKNMGIPLLEGYGLSEASPVVSLNPPRGLRKPGTIGLPIPGVRVKIVDENGGDLPPNTVGEIAVQGPNVMRGYLNNPVETAQTIRNGWLLTGDMGLIDEDKYIKIVDRKKDMIIVRGMKVYSKEVEDILAGHPAVAQAAVVAREDNRRGEVPVAAVILKPGQHATLRDITKYCQEKLADYKLPRKVLFVQEFPRNATGKILKRDLAKLF